MEVTNTMGASALVRKYLESSAGSELLAEMVKMAATCPRCWNPAAGPNRRWSA